MKKLFDTLEVAACLVLLLLSECWIVAANAARAIVECLERLFLVLLYVLSEICDTVRGLCAEEGAEMA